MGERLHLVIGGEVRSGGKKVFRMDELLAERAVRGILRDARAAAGTEDVPVSRLRAGEVTAEEIAELLSPTLFADERVVILEDADEAGSDAVALIATAAADLPDGTVLVVLHSGGGRAKALAGQLRKLDAAVHDCAALTTSAARIRFIRQEFRTHRVTVDEDTVTALLDAVGSDLRDLASVCSQLVADTGGHVDAAAVRRYHIGRAEVTGFDIADRAVTGDVAGSAEALRWARASGVPTVLVADALAEAVHTIARVRPLPGDHFQLARELRMPQWRAEKVRQQSRRWTDDSVATAIGLVADLNADVKGAAADADYALEAAVRRVAELAARGGR